MLFLKIITRKYIKIITNYIDDTINTLPLKIFLVS